LERAKSGQIQYCDGLNAVPREWNRASCLRFVTRLAIGVGKRRRATLCRRTPSGIRCAPVWGSGHINNGSTRHGGGSGVQQHRVWKFLPRPRDIPWFANQNGSFESRIVISRRCRSPMASAGQRSEMVRQIYFKISLRKPSRMLTSTRAIDLFGGCLRRRLASPLSQGDGCIPDF